MPTTSSKKKANNGVTIVKKMRDYSNDPVFKKKAEDAAAFIKKHGLPKSFTKAK